MLDFAIINVATIIAVVAGGISMGVYLAYATKCGFVPSLTTLIVLGWSFLVPLGVTQVFTAEGGVDLQRVAERMALWALFALHARIGVRLVGHYRGIRAVEK